MIDSNISSWEQVISTIKTSLSRTVLSLENIKSYVLDSGIDQEAY